MQRCPSFTGKRRAAALLPVGMPAKVAWAPAVPASSWAACLPTPAVAAGHRHAPQGCPERVGVWVRCCRVHACSVHKPCCSGTCKPTFGARGRRDVSCASRRRIHRAEAKPRFQSSLCKPLTSGYLRAICKLHLLPTGKHVKVANPRS